MRTAPLSLLHRFRPTRRVARTLGSAAVVFTLAALIPGQRGLATAQTQEPTEVGSATSEVMTRVGVVDFRNLPHTLAATRTGTIPHRQAPLRFPYTTVAQHAARARAAALARRPAVRSAPVSLSGVLHNFLGIDAVDNFRVNAQDFAPPDQGLCVGPGVGGTGTGVLEMVNTVATLYDT